MKENIVILLMFLCIGAFSQTPQYLVKFKATDKANVEMGVYWDFKYAEQKFPLNIDFDGKVLNMIYESGNEFLKIEVISFEKKEEKAKDKLGVNYEVYILKVIYQGFDAYIIIEIKNSSNYSIKTLKIPYYDKFGEVKSYRYFQEFK